MEPPQQANARIILLPGSPRSGSTNVAVLRTAMVVSLRGIEATIYEHAGALPHLNPDDDPDAGPVAPRVADLRSALGAADAILICTPEYAGATR